MTSDVSKPDGVELSSRSFRINIGYLQGLPLVQEFLFLKKIQIVYLAIGLKRLTICLHS